MPKYEVRSYTKYTVLHEHVVVVQEVLGRVLKGSECVHHADENPRNNAKDNLVICPDQAYHKLLHIRTKAFNVSGDANKRACAICKTYDSLDNMAIHARKGAMSYVHRSCRRNKDNDRYMRLKENGDI